MAKNFNFVLSTPDAVLFDGQSEYVGLPTPNGEIGIMADHVPLVGLISPGVMKIIAGKDEKLLAVGGGFVKVKPGIVKVYAQTGEYAESIDEQRAIEAQKEALKLMRAKADRVSLADATALLERNIARLKTIEHKKRRRRT